MTGYVLLLVMGLCAWWAWPAAHSWQAKFWTGFVAVFLAPFSWPWLIARGGKARREAKRQRALAAEREAERLRREHIQWWLNERREAVYDDDMQRYFLADSTLRALGWLPPDDDRAVRQYGALTWRQMRGSELTDWEARARVMAAQRNAHRPPPVQSP